MKLSIEMYGDSDHLAHDVEIALRVASKRARWYVRTTNGKADALVLANGTSPHPWGDIDYEPAAAWLERRKARHGRKG